MQGDEIFETIEKRKNKRYCTGLWFSYFIWNYFCLYACLFCASFSDRGESMEPTLKDGQLIFCSAALKGRIEKGDIITAIISPKANVPKKYLTEDGKLNIIKRVIGAPGDTVEIRDNAVYVNHKQIEESYLDEPMKTRDCICKLKEDEWFVMGDNRNRSLDSRAFGAVRTKEIRNLVLNG
jgi:signal peptidase I